MATETTCRPRDLLNTASRDYPSAWSQADEFRAGHGASLPDWPAWCYLPMAGWHAIVSAARGSMSLDTIGAVARLAALGAWRCTQGIYRFDAALYDAIRETPVSGDIPSDVLYQLPEWSVYVETPGVAWMGSPMAGFFGYRILFADRCCKAVYGLDDFVVFVHFSAPPSAAACNSFSTSVAYPAMSCHESG